LIFEIILENVFAMKIVRGMATMVVATMVMIMVVMLAGVRVVICWIAFAMPVLGRCVI